MTSKMDTYRPMKTLICVKIAAPVDVGNFFMFVAGFCERASGRNENGKEKRKKERKRRKRGEEYNEVSYLQSILYSLVTPNP
jgi:hypothetical protein